MLRMQSIHLFIAFIWGVTYGADLDHQNARILKYDFDNIGLGPYQFSFESSDGIRREETGEVQNEGSKHQFVKVSGSFSYTGPDGHLYEVRYIADDQGFHPEGDHIKVPPFVPWIHHHHDDEHHDDGQYHHDENNGDPRSYTPNVEPHQENNSDPRGFAPDSSPYQENNRDPKSFTPRIEPNQENNGDPRTFTSSSTTYQENTSDPRSFTPGLNPYQENNSDPRSFTSSIESDQNMKSDPITFTSSLGPYQEDNNNPTSFTPKIESHRGIVGGNRYIPTPSTEFSPDSVTPRSGDNVLSDANHPRDSSSSHIPDSQSRQSIHFYPKPEAQTPSGYITPKPVGKNIDENEGSKYYIPPVNSE